MPRYTVFIRSATNWQQFARARKTTVRTNLSYEEAQQYCHDYNNNRTSRQIRKGTKAEFTQD
jgi:hypothetical protein